MNKNTVLFMALAAAFALTVSAPLAMAEPDNGGGLSAGQRKALAACKPDLDKFCKDIKPGGGRLIKCLKEHASELSADCQAARREKKDKLTESHPCAADAEKLCAGLKDKDRAACMKEHEKELSSACQAKRAERKAERKEKKKEDKEAGSAAGAVPK